MVIFTKTGVITCHMYVVKEFFLAIMSLLIVIVVIKSEFWRISCPHNFYLDFKATHEFYTSEIKVDVNLDFKEHFWRILKTTLISRQLMNFTSEIKVDFNLDFKEHFWRILKTTLISRQLMNFASKIKVDFNLQTTVLAHRTDVMAVAPKFRSLCPRINSGKGVPRLLILKDDT